MLLSPADQEKIETFWNYCLKHQYFNIGYPESEDKVRYYVVTNDGKVTSDNKHKMFGYKPHYRTITCAIAQEAEFRGI